MSEVAWAAGFFDGEGSTFIDSHGTKMVMSLGQVHLEPIERFHRAVGGLGRVSGPHATSNPRWHTQHRWLCRKIDDILAVCDTLWPYLSSIKKQQIIDARSKYLAARI